MSQLTWLYFPSCQDWWNPPLQSLGWDLRFSQGNLASSCLLYQISKKMVCGMQLCKVPPTESLQTFITEDWKPQHASSYQEEMVGGDGVPGYFLVLASKTQKKSECSAHSDLLRKVKVLLFTPLEEASSHLHYSRHSYQEAKSFTECYFMKIKKIHFTTKVVG